MCYIKWFSNLLPAFYKLFCQCFFLSINATYIIILLLRSYSKEIIVDEYKIYDTFKCISFYTVTLFLMVLTIIKFILSMYMCYRIRIIL